MYCQNCGAKISNPKAKYCPSCGSPIIYKKKTSPIIDAIILGSIIVLFIFAVIKISELMTNYRIGNIKQTNNNINAKTSKPSVNNNLPEVRAPSPGGKAAANNIKNPKFKLENEIKEYLKGTRYDVSVFYNKSLKGIEIGITVYHNPSISAERYLNMFAKVLSAAYSNPDSGVKFVVCNVKKKDDIKLSVAVGVLAAAKIPSYTWNLFGNNGIALIRWIEKHQSPPNVGKTSMCRFYNKL